jgi:hypothetical protein
MIRLVTRGRFTHDYVKALIGAPEDREPAVAQARTAVNESERFALCVVQLDTPTVSAEIVRDQCRNGHWNTN